MSGDVPAIHYTITTLQFCPALYLTIYQCVRIHAQKFSLQKHILILMIGLVLQLYVLIIAGMWFNISNDINSHNVEWSVFALILLWSFVNPATYSYVAEASKSAEEKQKEKKRMSTGAAVYSVFTKHFMKEKLLFVVGASFAVASAILLTYQGSLINDLTKLVTKTTLDPVTGELVIKASYKEVELKATALVGVWACASLARFIFDVVSALMFSRLEVWLRGAVFEKAMLNKQTALESGESNDMTDINAEFGASYASDVQGVVSLYSTLLRGVIVNILLIVANFVFLVLYNWEVAVATLCFLAIAVTSGPTELAGNAARSVQKYDTDGLGMLSEGVQSIDLDSSSEDLCLRHEKEILVPLKKSLFSQVFYTNSVDTYINFFSSFLTVIVVITMAHSVYDGEMDSSEFLGVFFIFKQLQKPAMKISSVLKSLIKKSANLERLNKTIFDSS